MKDLDLDEKLIHAVASHGYGICSDVEPVHEMEKVLFATDELTGLIGAAALMRPSKSVQDMELKSLKKKFKDKSFAAGCDRDIIRRGAEQLGWDLDDLQSQLLKHKKAGILSDSSLFFYTSKKTVLPVLLFFTISFFSMLSFSSVTWEMIPTIRSP